MDSCRIENFTCDAYETKTAVQGLSLAMARNVQRMHPAHTPKIRKDTMQHHGTTLGDLIEAFYSELVNEYGDEDLAEVIASTLINEMILAGLHVDEEIAAA